MKKLCLNAINEWYNFIIGQIIKWFITLNQKSSFWKIWMAQEDKKKKWHR